MSARSADRDPVPTPNFKPIPFKPRRGLLAVLAAMNALWIGALVYMYFATVRNAPSRTTAADRVQHDLQAELDDLNAATRPGADGSPSAPR